jgi:hemolysin activation/secretion protein
LDKASGLVPGQRYTLGEIRQMAAQITRAYREQGYFLAQVLVPAQDITDGVLRLHIVEGQVGVVTLSNQSAVSDRTATALLTGVEGNSAITQQALEERLLLLSDLPGVIAGSTLRPGAAPGTADLQIQLNAGPRITGNLETDNQGNHYTGTTRLGASVNVNELFGWGDVASVRVLSSGEGLTYGRVAYQAMAGRLTLGVAFSQLGYQLGGAFSSLQAKGHADTGTAYASYPLWRGRLSNLSAQWSADEKTFSDRTGAGSSSPAVKKSTAHTLGLKGNISDTAEKYSIQYGLSWMQGSLALQDATTRSNDASTAQSQGAFDKWNYQLGGQTNFASKRSVRWELRGQGASKNLDSSEKFSLGGIGGVRAYPAGEASGDEGQTLTLEVRSPAPALSQYFGGSTQAIAFVDTGTIRSNKSPWSAATGKDQRTLSGAGLGLSWMSPKKWTASAFWAFKLGDESSTSAPDAPWRIWLQAAKFF